MIEVVDKELIRRLRYVQGWSERRIARELGFARETVRKYLRQDPSEVPSYRLHSARPKPVLDPYLPILEQWLEEDEQQPVKQRRTARRMFLDLKEQYAYPGGESTIRRAVRELKARKREVFIPLSFEPGQRAEFDWGEAKVILGGQIRTVYLFCARLRYSGASFVLAFPSEKQEAFFEGHKAAFEFWQGVPHTGVYDNLKTAVQKVLRGRNRQEREAFVGLRMHYLFESVFCTPGEAHEKGAVENLVGYFRRRYLSPMPEFRSFTELNEHLLSSCRKDLERTMAGQKESVLERLEEEREHLLPLPPQAFDPSRQVSVIASSQSEVLFETNRYSVPAEYAGRRLSLKASVWWVRIYSGAECVAEHRRSYGRHRRVDDWRHYLPVLKKKPGAVPFAAALKNGELAPIYETFRRGLCERQPNGNREFVRLLELCLDHPVDQVTRAVEQAVRFGAYHVDAVKHLLEQKASPVPVQAPLDPERYPDLTRVRTRPPSIQAYNRLLGVAGS